MILRNATIQYKGYDPRDLSKGSGKRICKTCNNCGRVGYVEFRRYHDLCHLCSLSLPKSNETKQKISESKMGDKNPQYGNIGNKNPNYYNRGKNSQLYNKPLSEKHKQKLSDANSGNKHWNWKGGIANDRNHLLVTSQCIKLNTKIGGFDAHHLLSKVIIYLPHNLHSLNWHDLKNNKNMKEINKLAINYLRGELF